MTKGQGALEYLILIAVVLAVAAVTTMFLAGAFSGQKTSAAMASCQQAAANCRAMNIISPNACMPCETQCIDPTTGLDIISNAPGCGTACQACKQGSLTAMAAGQEIPQVFALKLAYSPDQLTIVSLDVITGFAPDRRDQPEGAYRLDVVSGTGQVLDSFRFNIPNMKAVDPFTEPGGVQGISSGTFTLIFDYYENVEEVKIYDTYGRQVL